MGSPHSTTQDIFLDLDGTLTDPKPGITRSIRHALIELGLEAPAADDLTWCIGPPLLASFETLTGDTRLAPKALSHYRERFSDVGLFENRVYDAVPEMLTALRGEGFRLWLATSKPHVYARRITAHFGLDAWLDDIFGSELDGTRADKTDLLTFAMAKTGAQPIASTMLGDRKHDMIGARNVDIAGIGALWGYGNRDELTGAGATCLAEDPAKAASFLVGGGQPAGKTAKFALGAGKNLDPQGRQI